MYPDRFTDSEVQKLLRNPELTGESLNEVWWWIGENGSPESMKLCLNMYQVRK